MGIALAAHAMETNTYNSHYNFKPQRAMVWNRDSDHIQGMWFCKRRECSNCAPIASDCKMCPKGHPKQHYFGGTIAQWRGKWGLSPTFRVEPWQLTNHQLDKGKGKGKGQGQGKGRGKGRDKELEGMRKELQAANAQLKLKSAAPT